jgi:predicted ATP-grasp superfamily ATP-dependent carboligase
VGANQGIFAPATLSRYCKLSFKYPVSTDDTGFFAASVAEFARKNGIELIVPVTDWTTLPLSRHREQFERICVLALPAHEALALASDKYRTIELARSLGVPVPSTWLLRSLQDLEALPERSFPIVVKDRFSVRWVGDQSVFGSVTYAYSREDAFHKIRNRLQQAGDVLIQDFVVGPGMGFSCFAIDGEIRLPFQWQRIRETDPRGSGSSSRKSVPLDAEILELSGRLITRAGFEGIAMVEYKREAVSGRPILMEINGRPWGSLQLAIASGVDYPRYVADHYLAGIAPPETIPYHKGITCRRITGELTHLENLRNGPPREWPLPYPNFWTSLAKIAVPWYPGMCYDDVSLSDPRPGVAEISDWFRIRLRRKAAK